MSYTITIKKTAAKELENLPVRIASKIVDAIYTLADHPRPAGCKKLKGEHHNYWRIRVGDYRVIYMIDDVIRIIDVHKIGHRKDIYE